MPQHFSAKFSEHTRRLADHLLTVPHGGTVSYGTLSQAAGIDVCKYRHCLHRARGMALDEGKIAFDTQRGVGLRRLTAEELPGIGSSVRRHVRLSARRGRRTMSTAIAAFNDVDPEVQRRFWAEAASLSLIEFMAADRRIRTMQKREKPLPVSEIARLLLKLIEA